MIFFLDPLLHEHTYKSIYKYTHAKLKSKRAQKEKPFLLVPYVINNAFVLMTDAIYIRYLEVTHQRNDDGFSILK